MEEKLPSDPSPEAGAASTSAVSAATNTSNKTNEPSNEPTSNNSNNSSNSSNNNNSSSTTSQATVPKPEKVNWHSRKISWGKDQIFGSDESNLDAANSAFTSATSAASPSATGEETTSSTNKDTTSSRLYQNSSLLSGIPSVVHEDEVLAEEEQDPDVLKAEHIQSLFAGKGGGTYNGNATRRNISSLGDIDLNDILKESPYESEAETYILRAIEDRERTSDGATSENPIMGNIPDDAISVLSNRSGSNVDDDIDNDSNDLAGASNANNTNTMSQSNSSPGHRTTASSRRTSVTVPSMLGRTARGNHHRRNQTMEAQLFGLASAIDAMQAQNWEQDTAAAADLPAWRSQSPMNIPGAEDTGMLSSAEALQQNASLLYNRGNKNRPRLDSGFLSSGGGVTNPDDGSSISEQGSRLSASGRGGSGAESQTSPRRKRPSVLNLQSLGKSFRHHKKTDSDFSTGTNSIGVSNSVNVGENVPLNSLHLADIEEGREEQEDGMRASFLDDNGEPDRYPGEQEDDYAGRRRTQDRKKLMEKQIVREFQDFFAPQKTTIILYFRIVLLYIALPLLGISAVLFYWGGCPPTGRIAYDGRPVNGTLWNIDGQRVDPDQASISWWLIYVVRLIVTFTLAKATEKLFIDYWAIRSSGSINLFGPWVTLLLLQSRGWPSTLFLWGLYNFCLLSGSSSFSHHWMYKASIGLFNEENPAGNVISSAWNHRIQAIAVALGMLAAVKRLLLGLYLGKRTFTAYADQLARVMKNILMISEVAALAKDFEREMRIRATRKGVSDNQYAAHLKAQRDKLFGIFDDMDEDGASFGGGMSTADRSSNWGGAKVEYIVDKEDRNPWSGSLSNAQQMRIIQLLGAWEEPVIAERKVEYISVTALLQFRRSMACLHTAFPFSGSFGLADTRENCVQSAQDVYRRLLLNEPDQTELNFETLALLGLQRDGTLNQAKLKEMIRLFRPNRDGSLSILEFVKSIDTVYKEDQNA